MPRGIGADGKLGLRLRRLSAMSRRRLYGLGLPPAPGLYFLNIELLVSLAMIGFFLLSLNGSDVVMALLFLGPAGALLIGRRTNTVAYEVTLDRQSPGGAVHYLSSGKDYHADFQLPSKLPDVREINLGLGFDFFGPLRYWGVIVTTDIGPLLLCTAEDQEAAQKEAREVKEFFSEIERQCPGDEDAVAANKDLAGRLLRMIPSMSSLASDLTVPLVGFGLAYAWFFCVKQRLPTHAVGAATIGFAGLGRFVDRFRFRKTLNRFLESEGLR
jgi:hypothetical protein